MEPDPTKKNKKAKVNRTITTETLTQILHSNPKEATDLINDHIKTLDYRNRDELSEKLSIVTNERYEQIEQN